MVFIRILFFSWYYWILFSYLVTAMREDSNSEYPKIQLNRKMFLFNYMESFDRLSVNMIPKLFILYFLFKNVKFSYSYYLRSKSQSCVFRVSSFSPYELHENPFVSISIIYFPFIFIGPYIQFSLVYGLDYLSGAYYNNN